MGAWISRAAVQASAGVEDRSPGGLGYSYRPLFGFCGGQVAGAP
jgi:hypothetical protein